MLTLKRIGLLFAKQDYVDRFISTLCSKVDYFQREIISDELNVIQLRHSRLYLLVCGKGQNNAIIGSAKLYHNYECKDIVSVDTCTWVYSKEPVAVGDIVEFHQNIINYDFKKRPEIYHYDECGISSYSLLYSYLNENRVSKSLLLTTNSDISSSEIMDNLKLKWQKYESLFADSSGYGVLAYCCANNLKLTTLRMIKGLVDNLTLDKVDNIVDYCIENEII